METLEVCGFLGWKANVTTGIAIIKIRAHVEDKYCCIISLPLCVLQYKKFWRAFTCCGCEVPGMLLLCIV
jgi:hypothetical protein